MKPSEFIAKWRNGGDERRDAQPFFEDLCRMLGHGTPKELDPKHDWFTYEYGATKTSGGNGWADVWKKAHFGWEAKGTHKNLDKAYEQLKMYADALQNPPLLIVSDLQTIVIHTNFTNTVKETHVIRVDELEDHKKRDILHHAFFNPELLKPGVTREFITDKAAKKFAALAAALRGRGHPPLEVAQFLNRLLFCMFAEEESIGLLPDQIFTQVVTASVADPAFFDQNVKELFNAMKGGGQVFLKKINWFNGGLFADDKTLPLTADELAILKEACELDWSEIDPSIFGTLFERGLDPNKRSQLGAHYTDPDTIMKIVGPVVVEPWQKRWAAEKAEISALMAKADIFGSTAKTAAEKAQRTKAAKEAEAKLRTFLDDLRHYTVLDPACGSGNFLFLALRSLKDIEHTVIVEAEALGLQRQFPGVGPENVLGIELNEYAAELARITIWIGEIQWMIQKGYGASTTPVLRPLNQIECRDALLNDDGSEAVWPISNAIVGNPPFIGNKKMIGELGEDYVISVRNAYKGRVPAAADFVCFWFEKANDAIVDGRAVRAGLVTTQSIRAGANRTVLEHIVKSTRIFDAWSDEPWVNEGAAVRVSMISYGHSDQVAMLDGVRVGEIYTNLTASNADGAGVDVTRAVVLRENANRIFQGTIKGGDFDVPGDQAREWLKQPNPNGQPNSNVVKPWVNGSDVVRRPSDTWVIDYGTDMDEKQASMYELPYAQALEKVKPVRAEVRRDAHRINWWRHAEARTGMRVAFKSLSRYIVTPRVAKHRLFAWQPVAVLPDSRLYAIARDDDTTMGVLHSRIHEVWSLATASKHGVGNDPTYNAASCFETFPFPKALTPNISAVSIEKEPAAIKISDAVKRLMEARDQWLNPPEWVEWTRSPEEETAGYPKRPVAKQGHEVELAERTLTALYNQRPQWLNNLHDELDAAVAAAYGWEWPLKDEEILEKLFDLNQERGAAETP